MSEPRQDRSTAWAIVVLTALALVLRVIALGYKPFWQDEVFSVLFVRSSYAQFWSVLKSAEINMALYYLLLREWAKWFSSEWGVRFLSVIPGVLTVPIIYALGKRLYSQRVGLWAAALLSVNACAVVYSQEARGYSLLVFFCALCSGAFLRAVERQKILDYALYILFAICAFYCHFYAVFVFLAQACALGFLPREKLPWKSFLLSWLIVGAAAIPGLRVVLHSQGSNLWWLPTPGLLEVYRTLTFLAAENGKAVGAVLATGFLIAIAVSLRESSGLLRMRSLESFHAAFAPLSLFLPMFVTLLLSFWRPLFFHRFLIICLVPFLLLAAAGLEYLRMRRYGFALAVLIFILSAVATGTSYHKVREDWRGAASFTADSRDPIVFYIKDAAAPFAYYRERQGHPLTLGQQILCDHQPSVPDAEEWAKLYPRLWLVHFPAGPKDAVEPSITGDLLSHYKLCDRRQFKGISVSWFCVREEHKTEEFRISPDVGTSNQPSHTP